METLEQTTRTLYDHAYQRLYEAIMTGRLQAGQPLIQEELSRALGISRGPLREAMRRLESEGLLVAEPHKGTRVAVVSPKDVVELYTIRGLLEGYAASSALERLRAEKLPLMAAELKGLDEAAQTQDWARVAELDTKWHRHIVTALGNRRLEETWARNNGPLRAIFAVAASHASTPDFVYERHRELLALLETSDPNTIEQAIRRHYLVSAHRLAGILKTWEQAQWAKPRGG